MHTINVYGTGTALGDAAAELGAHQVKVLTQYLLMVFSYTLPVVIHHAEYVLRVPISLFRGLVVPVDCPLIVFGHALTSLCENSRRYDR